MRPQSLSLPHGEGRTPEPSESPCCPAPPAPRLLPVPVACFASVFDLALTRVLPHQPLLSPSLLTQTPPHTVTSGREREQEPWPRFGESGQGFRGSGELLYCGGLHFGPPFRPCTMMYEMYVQTRDVYTANKDGVSIFISTARTGESFLVHRAGTGLEEGVAKGTCSRGMCGLLWGQGEGSCVSHRHGLGLGCPKQHRCGPGRPEALTFLETGMSSTLTKHYRNSLLLDKNRLFFPPVFM